MLCNNQVTIFGCTSHPFSCIRSVIIIPSYPNQYGPQRPQKEQKDLINDRVRFPEVLLISETGEQLGRMSSKEAYHIAIERELDLVCVAPNGNPPVCKLLNYNKYRYEQNKRAKESKKKQKIIEVKEVQLTPQIGIHDLEVKAKAARKFLQDGNRVKVGVRFRGRQLTHIEVGQETLNRFIEMLQDVCKVDKAPVLEGKWLNCILVSTVK